MYNPSRDDTINECDSDNDSFYEDEDETTRIIPPSGNPAQQILSKLVVLSANPL